MIAAAVATLSAASPSALAQTDRSPPQADPSVTDAPAAPAPLSPEELDKLVAAYALYPDALLTQVLIAATWPLELVKAARWAEGNEGLEGDARADAAAAEGWDPSVTVLAAGFPAVLAQMSEDLDGVEALGDAVLTDTDAVLDAVQRQRGRAAAFGNLESNEAQTVTVEDDVISIAPANPEVVYVPAYDPVLAYSQTAPAPPVVVTDPSDDGYSEGSLLAAGVIGFGAGLLIAEIFEDDDDYWGGWGGYWGGPPPVDWNDGAFYGRPSRGDVNIDGDVIINRDRDLIDVDRGEAWRPDPDRAEAARDRVAARDRDRRPGGATERPAQRDAIRGPDRAAARERIAARSEGGSGAARAERPVRAAEPAQRDRPATGPRQAAPRAGAFSGREQGLSGARQAAARGAASAGARPSAVGKPETGRNASAFDRKPERSGARASSARDRGGRSGGGDGKRAGGGRR
jgi:hypothetical protein